MPYRTSWEPAGFLLEHSGLITGDEIDQANQCFFSDPRSDTARYQIIDCSLVTEVDISVHDMSRTAAYDLGASRSNPQIKLAFVSTHPDMTLAIEKYITVSKNLKTSWRFGIFEDIERAREWAEM